jgi:hypothetical protein
VVEPLSSRPLFAMSSWIAGRRGPTLSWVYHDDGPRHVVKPARNVMLLTLARPDAYQGAGRSLASRGGSSHLEDESPLVSA